MIYSSNRWSVPLAFVAIVLASQLAQAGVTLFVAPGGKDGAFAELQAALDIVTRTRAAHPDQTTPITIELAGGTYFLAAPAAYRPTGNLSAPLTIQAAADAKVVLSGGLRIDGWHQAVFNGHACWAATLPGEDVLPTFRELWVNGRRATRARFPQQGYLAVPHGVPQPEHYYEGQTFLPFDPTQVPTFALGPDVEAVVADRWAESRVPILAIDAAAHQLRLGKRTVFASQGGDLFWLEGSPSFFNSPGQWYADRAAHVLYYLPLPKDDMHAAEVIAPRLQQLLTIAGPASGERVSQSVTIRNITFAHAEWNLPSMKPPAPTSHPAAPWNQDPGSGFPQAEVGVPAAVRFSYAANCRIENCRFEHLGCYALSLGEGCQSDAVSHCDFTDLGAGGIKIGTNHLLAVQQTPYDPPVNQAPLTHGNTVADCHITDGGHFFPSAVGIWIGQSFENTITHNEIADFYYTGISVGWTWGYGPAQAMGNVIDANLVHHIGKKSDGDGPFLSDMGGIYTLGSQPGTWIHNNVFHDIAARVYGGWGIYLDEGSSGILVENNLVYRTTHGGFHQHYGQDNLIRNNIFADGGTVQIVRTRPEPHRSFTFERNIVVGNSDPFVQMQTPAGVLFDNNLYWRSGRDQSLRFGKLTWEQWKAAGQDANSIVADPGFADAANGNFDLPAQSPATRVGFLPFQYRTAGVR